MKKLSSNDNSIETALATLRRIGVLSPNSSTMTEMSNKLNAAAMPPPERNLNIRLLKSTFIIAIELKTTKCNQDSHSTFFITNGCYSAKRFLSKFLLFHKSSSIQDREFLVLLNP